MSCSPRDQALLPPSSAEQGFVTARLGRRNSADLTPASGRQDHTILPSAATSLVRSLGDRSQAFRPALQPIARSTLPRPPHPSPTSVTIAIRPSGGVGWREFVEMICPTGEAKYFCKGDWTGQITLIRFNNFRRARTTMPSSLPCRVV